jgi:hypothetical protein
MFLFLETTRPAPARGPGELGQPAGRTGLAGKVWSNLRWATRRPCSTLARGTSRSLRKRRPDVRSGSDRCPTTLTVSSWCASRPPPRGVGPARRASRSCCWASAGQRPPRRPRASDAPVGGGARGVRGDGRPPSAASRRLHPRNCQFHGLAFDGCPRADPAPRGGLLVDAALADIVHRLTSAAGRPGRRRRVADIARDGGDPSASWRTAAAEDDAQVLVIAVDSSEDAPSWPQNAVGTGWLTGSCSSSPTPRSTLSRRTRSWREPTVRAHRRPQRLARSSFEPQQASTGRTAWTSCAGC